ncbi:hypothetical protein B6R96_32010 [Streptomyces sp. Sge12]|nr:hypothetical protein B6R96_32010 [Streptomyces sp. Sge12]
MFGPVLINRVAFVESLVPDLAVDLQVLRGQFEVPVDAHGAGVPRPSPVMARASRTPSAGDSSVRAAADSLSRSESTVKQLCSVRESWSEHDADHAVDVRTVAADGSLGQLRGGYRATPLHAGAQPTVDTLPAARKAHAAARPPGKCSAFWK